MNKENKNNKITSFAHELIQNVCKTLTQYLHIENIDKVSSPNQIKFDLNQHIDNFILKNKELKEIGTFNIILDELKDITKCYYTKYISPISVDMIYTISILSDEEILGSTKHSILFNRLRGVVEYNERIDNYTGNRPLCKIPKPVETVALKDVTGYFKLSLESPATYSKLKLPRGSVTGSISCVSFMNGQCTGTVVPIQNIYLAVFPVDDLN